jgi:hypothetical protein
MESAKVYLLNRNQLERSPLMTAPMTASRPKLLDQDREAIRTRHYITARGPRKPMLIGSGG